MLALSCIDLKQFPSAGFIAAHATDRDRQDSERFWRPHRRLQRLAGRALLRAMLAGLEPTATSWQITEAPEGSPLVVSRDGAIRRPVSIAHSHDLVACALADHGRVGIDLEYDRPGREASAMAAWVFGPRERQVCARDGAAAFYRIWTLREALAKACGIGFAKIIDGSDVFADSPAVGLWPQVIDGENWIFAVRTLPGSYTLALALDGRHALPDIAAGLAALDAR